MMKKALIQKAFIVTIFIMVVPFAFASLTISGTIDEANRSSKFSLKNINKYTQKSFSLSLLRTNLQNNGTLTLKNFSFNSEANSFIQINNGNTTYVLPYKFKVKVPKFKTPSPNN